MHIYVIIIKSILNLFYKLAFVISSVIFQTFKIVLQNFLNLKIGIESQKEILYAEKRSIRVAAAALRCASGTLSILRAGPTTVSSNGWSRYSSE